MAATLTFSIRAISVPLIWKKKWAYPRRVTRITSLLMAFPALGAIGIASALRFTHCAVSYAKNGGGLLRDSGLTFPWW